MPITKANGIDIAYESYGKVGDPAVLMIMGLGAQLAMWSQEMIDAIVADGHRVVVFDNRDIGLSEKFSVQRAPNIFAQVALKRIGVTMRTPYDLSDMAHDTIGLLDALEIERAHVLGVSMGGMIAQFLCAKHPSRVSSLTAIMTTTGNPKLPRPSRKIIAMLTRKSPAILTREESIDLTVNTFRIIGTPGEDHDTNGYRERIAESYDRCYNPDGRRRQSAAIIASGDFRRTTKRIKTATLVIHGSEDPLVPVEGGIDVYDTIAASKLEIIEGMGHDIPPKHLPEILSLIRKHFRAAS